MRPALAPARHAAVRPPPRLAGARAAAAAPSDRVATAVRFYEEAWSRPDGASLLPDLVAEQHVQRDAVWQEGRESVGRDRLAKGMRHMRRAVYPDISFVVKHAAESDERVMVEWRMAGTFEGRADTGAGVTVFEFDGAGRIAASTVYRTALPAEVDLARRTAAGEVKQGVLLGRGEAGAA